MNTTRLIENLYQVSIHGTLSRENEQYLAWIQEFLSMFDFLWNHSELFMEIIDIPTNGKGKINGFYNTVYAQFFKYSFEERKQFKDMLSVAHGNIISKFLKTRKLKDALPTGGYIFHQYNGSPVAKVYWQYSTYPHETSGYKRIFGMGVLVRNFSRKNIFARLLYSIFKKRTIRTNS